MGVPNGTATYFSPEYMITMIGTTRFMPAAATGARVRAAPGEEHQWDRGQAEVTHPPAVDTHHPAEAGTPLQVAVTVAVISNKHRISQK